jgi:hypothetical protein
MFGRKNSSVKSWGTDSGSSKGDFFFDGGAIVAKDGEAS